MLLSHHVPVGSVVFMTEWHPVRTGSWQRVYFWRDDVVSAKQDKLKVWQTSDGWQPPRLPVWKTLSNAPRRCSKTL
jgi:hypothetical protein